MVLLYIYFAVQHDELITTTATTVNNTAVRIHYCCIAVSTCCTAVSYTNYINVCGTVLATAVLLLLEGNETLWMEMEYLRTHTPVQQYVVLLYFLPVHGVFSTRARPLSWAQDHHITSHNCCGTCCILVPVTAVFIYTYCCNILVLLYGVYTEVWMNVPRAHYPACGCVQSRKYRCYIHCCYRNNGSGYTGARVYSSTGI